MCFGIEKDETDYRRNHGLRPVDWVIPEQAALANNLRGWIQRWSDVSHQQFLLCSLRYSYLFLQPERLKELLQGKYEAIAQKKLAEEGKSATNLSENVEAMNEIQSKVTKGLGTVLVSAGV